MKVLVVGGGGREHALAWKIRQSPRVKQIFCAPGNPGTDGIAENVDIPVDDIERLLNFALEKKIDLTIVGPEQPLVMGICDRFREKGLRIFGPSAKAAQIEGSKAFCKDLMKKYGIPTAEYQILKSPDDEASLFATAKGPIVVKASGLAAGKGVLICRDSAEARRAVESIMVDKAFGDAGNKVVVEEFLEGQEVSVLAFTDGKTVIPLESAQDHKAAHDGDKGPNTGGMGAYSPAPALTEQALEKVKDEILLPAVRAMEQENCPYQGILYAGLMMTKDGPKVLEFNARFGDPETQPLLMRLQGDIVPLFEACIDGNLCGHSITWSGQASVCVVMASEGYPGAYPKGLQITGLAEASKLADVMVFHSGTKRADGEIVTDGGRVLGVTAMGEDIESAIAQAYNAADKISWPGARYRKDIGRRAVE
jgi:phosphoribosylamine--glycine ligase